MFPRFINVIWGEEQAPIPAMTIPGSETAAGFKAVIFPQNAEDFLGPFNFYWGDVAPKGAAS